MPYKEKCSAAAYNPLFMATQSSSEPPQHNHRTAPKKISITAARKMLGMVDRNYSDEDMGEVLNALYGIAEDGFDIYQDTSNVTKRRD